MLRLTQSVLHPGYKVSAQLAGPKQIFALELKVFANSQAAQRSRNTSIQLRFIDKLTARVKYVSSSKKRDLLLS